MGFKVTISHLIFKGSISTEGTILPRLVFLFEERNGLKERSGNVRKRERERETTFSLSLFLFFLAGRGGAPFSHIFP
jgi:hypothetical protein